MNFLSRLFGRRTSSKEMAKQRLRLLIIRRRHRQLDDRVQVSGRIARDAAVLESQLLATANARRDRQVDVEAVTGIESDPAHTAQPSGGLGGH